MKNDLLLLIKKHRDTLIEQTKTKPQETLEFKMNEQKETFSFSPRINLSEEEKWPLRATSVECTNSVFIIIDENNSFSLGTPGNWNSEDGEEFYNKLIKLLELRSDNDIELHVKEVEKGGTRKEKGNSGYNLAGFDPFKSDILSQNKNSEM